LQPGFQAVDLGLKVLPTLRHAFLSLSRSGSHNSICLSLFARLHVHFNHVTHSFSHADLRCAFCYNCSYLLLQHHIERPKTLLRNMRGFTLVSLMASTATVLTRPYPPDGTGASMEHYEVLHMRGTETVNPNAIFGTVCTDPTAYARPLPLPYTVSLVSSRLMPCSNINFHDADVALLSICGGISGTIEQCEGSPASTTGSSGDALFSLTPTDAGATINVSKGRWEGCVRAARAACPSGSSFTSTCVGGANPSGNLNFSLALQ
jgi:hypothetical protein